MKKDSIHNNLIGIEEQPWPVWSKGERTRLQIVELLKKIPNPSIEQIAQTAGISTRQARRQRANLVAAGLWKSFGCVILFGTGLFIGAYYASPEMIDELVECRIKFPVHQFEEEILWNLEEFL